MKNLVKTSLVAALAVGALSSVASAKPLEDAIKDVDVSGFMRIQYTNVHVNNNNGADKNTTSAWNYKNILNAKIALDDNFYAFVGLRYSSSDTGIGSQTDDENNHVGSKVYGDGSDNFSVHQAYLGYKAGNTDVRVGRQELGSFFTDDMSGSGIKVLNNDIQGLTLAAFWFDSLEKDGDVVAQAATDNNLYGVAAIGSYDPISFQFWYNQLQDVAKLFAVEVAGDFNINDDVALGFKGQYAFTSPSSEYKATLAKSNFYGLELNADLYNFDMSLGYVTYKTKDNKLSFVSFEDDGQFLKAGEQLINYNTLYDGKYNIIYATAGYTFFDDKIRIGADYVKQNHKLGDSKTKSNEWVARASYKYSDNLSFSSYFSRVTTKSDDNKNKQDKLRFEAKYTF